ncbi:disease resistance protein RUN1-like [Vicia villosa]|uniref:disease resistance protein RUN1-like n=1 Tax=Vicia villosa TaxID=3911 RepID=UPI00273C6F5A|nr:disease resistance protein RUN1-like [Vicia villosa]
MDSFSSSSNRQWINDVFINFRGEDTRKSFVSHLHAALSNAGINTYIDNQLHKGQELGPELSRAIEWSHISIVVFSKRYTESYWCLNELKKVMECHRNHGQLVLPIFYDVDPSVVRRQSGDFGEALLSTAEKSYSSGEERMEYVLSKWRSALTQAANLSGWDVNNCRSEAELMQQIVENVLEKLNTGFLPITDFPVGLESRVHEVVEFIVTQPNRLCMIGIWGMGGSGKTTTAKAIYNQIHRKFVDKCFIENIREICEKDNRGIIHVQQQLLSDILNSKEMIPNIALGTTIIERRLQGKRVLVVLDDVTTFKQLKALFRNLTFFGSGSVFIVTTRDARILKLLEVSHVCTMKEMDEKESLELFCWHAFRQPIPMIEFSELSRSVAAYCGGLPLALEVIGSSLYERTKEEWESVLSKLERIPNDQVQEKLRTSYDGLKDDMEKDIFLDICCFFIGKDRSYVTKILNGCKLHADIGITILIERCLVKIERNNKLGMHDLTRDMGREIVRKSSAKEPGKRSRLWFHQDVHDILTKNSGTETVEGLVLKLQRTSRVSFNANSFKEMKNMRLLQLDCVDLAGDYGCLSKELRWVCWQEFTMNYIPDDFYLGNLVVIDLKHSNIKQVWNETKLLGNLKILNLSHSKYLKSTPDFSKSPNLEKLIMKNCPNLSEVHQSIGDLRSLLLINLKDCKSLNNLPENIYQLKSLKTLILSGCTKIDKLEEDIVQMESLTTLIAKDTAIKEVPYSIVRSRNIEYISLCGYEGLTRDVFPSLIWSWMSPTMNSLPQISPIGNMALSLTSINAQNNNMGFLSPMIRSLSQLRTVWLQCRSKTQLTQELRRILDDKYDVNFTKWETSSSSHITNLFLRSLLIGMGSCHIVIDALGKSISQGLTANDSSGFFLPCGNYPSCLGYTGEGPSALFQVPKDIDHQLKGIILCVVYSSTSENMGAECLTSVLIVNYTKCTIQIYKRDTVMSFNGEDWKNVSSNLGPGDDVEIFVAFGHGLIVKETAVYLIYGQSITMEIESSTNMEMELSANVKVEASITTEIEQSITMEVELPTNTEMEPLAKMDVQPSPEGNMQPSPNVTVEASTNVKTNQSPEVKVRSSGIIKTNPSPAPKKSIFTRLAKRIGRCLCCN